MPLNVCETPVAMPTPRAVSPTATHPLIVAAARASRPIHALVIQSAGTPLAFRGEPSPVDFVGVHLHHAGLRHQSSAWRHDISAHKLHVQLHHRGTKDVLSLQGIAC